MTVMMGDFAFRGDSADQVISKGERKGRIVGCAFAVPLVAPFVITQPQKRAPFSRWHARVLFMTCSYTFQALNYGGSTPYYILFQYIRNLERFYDKK